jgi:hypothetical protein
VNWLFDLLPYVPRRETERRFDDLWSYVMDQTEEITKMGERMTSAENEAYARAAEVVGLIKAEFASLREQLDSSAEALSADAQADADRLNGLMDELASVLPAEVPEVPTPEPGQPAELPAEDAPADGGTEVVNQTPGSEG